MTIILFSGGFGTSFKEIKKIFPGSKLELDLRVRVNPKWKSNDMILSKVFRETRD